MDWTYVSSTIEQGVLGLILLLFPVPFLSYNALRNRRIVACSPGLAGAISFLGLSLISGFTSHQSSDAFGYLPIAGLAVVTALIPFSVRALRSKWVGLLHLSTVAGCLLLTFLSAMAIAHDWVQAAP